MNRTVGPHKAIILENAHAQIQSGLIRTILTDDAKLLAGNNRSNLPDWIAFIDVHQANFDQLADARASAVYLTSLDNLDQALALFNRVGLSQIPFLHVNAQLSEAEFLATVSRSTGLAQHYQVTSANLALNHSDSHAACDISVIVPVYGVEQHIEKCVLSLREQQFTGRYEVLFIDDASPDGSAQIIERIIAGHPHLKLLTKANGGAASARNFGLAHASGQYIGFVDGDDCVTADFLDRLYRAAILHNVDIAQAGFSYMDADSGAITVQSEPVAGQEKPSGTVVAPAFPLMRLTPGIWRRLYRRRFLDKFGISFNADFRRHDDLPFNIETLANADRVAVTPEPVYFYLQGREGQDIAATDQRLFIHFRLFEFTNQRITRQYWDAGFFHSYILTMFSHHLWAYDRIDRTLKPAYLRGMAQQLFGNDGPIGKIARLRILSQHFPTRRGLIAKAALLSLLPAKPLPGDI